MKLRVLYQDSWLVAVDKPAGLQVHPPESGEHTVRPDRTCLHLLRKQLGQYVYPVHRLDRATSGVLLFALSSEVAGRLQAGFASREIHKTYYCVTRGWVPEVSVWNRALKSESSEERIEAVTSFTRMARIELPCAVGRYPTARYSLVRVEPETGRYHQIRRHFQGASYPLIGDTVYGDGAHNRFFREQYGLRGLLLKAHAIELPHPVSGESLRVESRWGGAWHRVFDLFGVCPRG